ncbi:Protein IBD2 [Nakaseomyces glabratus]|nr:hypothetical protein J6894_03062 [Nakaseomyces glabratus]QNG15134.1 uncharacterized protein GWK60_J05929 [Nakaseomyces glabratus]SCV15484.1 Protein IBD2 [Nakaseomyces glabratus]SLM14746.1 Protein IBD2 [Nakaseomyces glabratus]
MSSNNQNTNNTSIELISENGPISLNLMMEEGVKALTRILSNQLNDTPGTQPMHFIIKKNDKDNKAIDINGDDEEVVELGNESNYHMSDGVQNEAEIILNDQLNDILKNHESQLRLDGEEAEIIFDYETQGTVDGSDSIGEKITQMIESVLPNGLGPNTTGKLQAVLNGKELNITEETHKSDRIEEEEHIEGGLTTAEGNFEVEFETEPLPEDHKHTEENIDGHENYNDCCPHHHNNQDNRRRAPKYKNYNYHDYEYTVQHPKTEPNFSALINQKKPVCLFCEYYMVFGEPPKNMIKWYNMHYGYNHLPQRNDRHHRNR